MKKSDLITEVISEKIKGEKINQEPLDYSKEAKPKRSKWIKWLLNIIDNIVTTLT
jgi:hypothetical protein